MGDLETQRTIKERYIRTGFSGLSSRFQNLTMEVAASGIAVATIAIQVLASTEKVKRFIRNIKDAPQELVRISNLLDNLRTLLEAVTELLKHQASLEEYLFPAPDILHRCVKGCEEGLAPLKEIVDKYAGSQATTRTRRLQAGIRTALKAGDLQGLEMRLQQEIISLNAALVVNGNKIQCVQFLADIAVR